MKFCQPHWEALRKAIDDRGLTHLIAGSGREAARQMQAQAKGDYGLENFDPLMDAHNRILSHGLDVFGLSLMEGDNCPLCWLGLSWINKAADESKEEAERLQNA